MEVDDSLWRQLEELGKAKRGGRRFLHSGSAIFTEVKLYYFSHHE